MRGFLLSLDAIVAAGFLLLLAAFISGLSFSGVNEEAEVKRVYYEAKDLNNLLFETRLIELLEFNVTRNYLGKGPLNRDDVNRTFIDIVGYWWSVGNMSHAMNFTGEILNSTLNRSAFGYEILFDNTTIYRKDAPQKKFLTKAYSIISGFGLGLQPEGFVASAFATQLKRNNTLILPFNPEGSGVEQGENVGITKRFYLNSTEITNIANATLYLSIHFGKQDINSMDFKVNNNNIDASITWIYNVTKVINGKRTQLYFGQADVTTLLANGAWNEIEFELSGDNSWHSHVHPGFRLELLLRQNVSTLASSPVEDKTYYFDHIESEASGQKKGGAWSIFPFFIPKGANVTNVSLSLKGKGINNISASNIPAGVPNKYNIQVYLNNLIIDLKNPASQDESTEVDVTLNYNLTGNVIEGTNVVSVYFNSYGDDFWGKKNTILHSDPQGDPQGSSFLRVVYGKPPTEQRYGHIQVGVRELLGGVRENPKAYNKSFNGSQLFRTFLHIAQLDSSNVTVNVSYPGSLQTAFRTPRSFATPSTVFIDPQILSTTENNTIALSDTCTNKCDFLPESSFEYFVWVPSLVGYGALFPNSSLAVQDALDRLNGLLGQYAQISDLVVVNQSVPKVPTLWGPARMEIRVWV